MRHSHPRRQGASVVFVALILSGAGYESAIVDGGGERTNQWRVAHSGGVQNGLLAMAVGAAQPYLVFTSRGTRARTALAFALMAWSNSVAYNLGAATGQRGLTPICLSLERGFPYLFCGEGLASLANVAVNAAFVVGMAATLYGFYQLLRAAHRGATEAAAA